MELSPKQQHAITNSTARICVYHGAVRSGKTYASLLAFLALVQVAGPSGLILICGKTLQTIERNVLDPLMDPALFGQAALKVRHTRGSNVATILGRTVHLIGANDARAEGRLRGLTAQLGYADEASLLPEAFWTQLLARLSVPGARLLATTNPDSPRHWLKKDYIDRAGDLNLKAWHFALADNPSLDPAYVASLKAEYTGLWYRRMIDGAWVVAEGAIYDMWDEARHVVTDLPQMTTYWVGIDYGTSNPFSAILLGLGVDNRLYACAEWRYDSRAAHQQMTDAQYAEAVTKWLAKMRITPEWVFVDPSAASFISQLHEDDALDVRRANNDVLAGIRTVATVLAADRLKVHVSCTGLLEEMPGYSWDSKAADMGEDKPLKQDDHSVDAARYAVISSLYEWQDYVPLTAPAAAAEAA